MERLNSLYAKASSAPLSNPITFEFLERQKQNFFIIGVDGKNPWKGQTHKLCPLDVKKISSRGVKIIATPHIGLHWASNSFYPHMGVTICDYSGNQSRIDRLDEPEYIKEGTSKHDCAIQEHAVLSPYLLLNKEVVARNGYISAKKFASASNLAYVHHHAKKLALGEENVMLDSDLFEKPFVFDFFKVLIENQKQIFHDSSRFGILDRFVSNEGIISRRSPGGVADIESFIKMKQLHKQMILEDCHLQASGFFPLNEVNILFDSICCYWQQLQLGIASTSIGDTYTVSGVDMILYTKNPFLREILDRMYKTLLASGKFTWLPKYMGNTMLPGGTFSFLPSNKEEELYESVVELLDINSKKDSLHKEISMSSDEANRFRLVNKSREIINPKMSQIKDRFQKALKERRGFTQYDLLNGEYVPNEIIQRLMPMTFEKINGLFKSK